jgi:hypothetical protein
VQCGRVGSAVGSGGPRVAVGPEVGVGSLVGPAVVVGSGWGGTMATTEPSPPTQVENDALRRDNERLARELARTKAALDVVGKAHALLELLSESAEPEKRSKP